MQIASCQLVKIISSILITEPFLKNQIMICKTIACGYLEGQGNPKLQVIDDICMNMAVNNRVPSA